MGAPLSAVKLPRRRLAVLLLVLPLLAAAPARAELIAGGECKSLANSFGSTNFQYEAELGVTGTMPPGCTLSVTKLYMGGTCTTQRNNEGYGCSGSGTVLPTTAAPINSDYCRTTFQDAPSSAVVTLSAPTSGTSKFDSAWLCTQYSTGFFFAKYDCNSTESLQLSLPLAWNNYGSGCGSGSSSSLPDWARITVGVVCGLVAVALFFAAFKACTRRSATQPAVQLAAQPAYYGGSAAYAGPTPAQQPGYAGAWGTQPAPAGYPPAGGAGYPPAPAGYPSGAYPGSYGSGAVAGGPYGQAAATRPQHVPPPMQTVVLGAPVDEAPGTTGVSGVAGDANAKV